MLVIGRNPVLEALKYNPQSIEKIVLLESVSDNKIKEIRRICDKNNIKVEITNKKDFEKIFDKKNKSEGISQGILAKVEDFKYTGFSAIQERVKTKNEALLLILDEVQDPHNLGAIIRTSAASGADGIILTEKNTAKVNHTVIKASAGAVNHIGITQSKNIYKTMEELKDTGFKILGTSLKSEKSLYDLDFKGKYAIVLGNEGEGIRKNILKLCDELFKIPLAGRIESLNVSVSAGVILYEVLRQRG
jgi:23S rRNA (guanosine2251-2'-O)-methyltransferase